MILRLKNHRTLAVWRSTHRYPLSFVKIGRAVLYRRKDVEKFLAEHLVEAKVYTEKAFATSTR